MDKVYLNSKDIQEIGKGNIPSSEDFNVVWKYISVHGFFLNEFWIICEPTNIRYQVVIEKAMDFMQTVKIKKVWYDNDGLAHNQKVTMPTYLWRIKYIELMGKENSDIDPDFELSVLPMMFMQYVTYAMLHREIEEIEPEIRSGNSSTSTRSPQKQTRISLTECIKRYRHKNKNRKYERRTESWPRRGGVRHMKSGKIVPYSGTTCKAKDKPVNPIDTDRSYRL